MTKQFELTSRVKNNLPAQFHPKKTGILNQSKCPCCATN